MILLLNGCKGRMGQAVTRLCEAAGHTVYGADADIPLASLPEAQPGHKANSQRQREKHRQQSAFFHIATSKV